MRRVLELIRKHDGKWSWYQLERVLAGEEISKSRQLMPLLKCLEVQQLIRTVSAPGYPDPLYSITDKGLAYLDEHESEAQATIS
jgi:DNA-binding PadR family transcriptional regulator